MGGKRAYFKLPDDHRPVVQTVESILLNGWPSGGIVTTRKASLYEFVPD